MVHLLALTRAISSAFVKITSHNSRIKSGERFGKQVLRDKNISLQRIFEVLLTYFLPQTIPPTSSENQLSFFLCISLQILTCNVYFQLCSYVYIPC